MKVLITGGRSAQAMKLLKRFENDTIVFADYGEVPSMSTAHYHFITLGNRNDDIIAHNLLSHCLGQSVDAVLPLQGFEIDEIAKSTVLFEEFGIKVLMPDTDQIIYLK